MKILYYIFMITFMGFSWKTWETYGNFIDKLSSSECDVQVLEFYWEFDLSVQVQCCTSHYKWLKNLISSHLLFFNVKKYDSTVLVGIEMVVAPAAKNAPSKSHPKVTKVPLQNSTSPSYIEWPVQIQYFECKIQAKSALKWHGRIDICGLMDGSFNPSVFSLVLMDGIKHLPCPWGHSLKCFFFFLNNGLMWPDQWKPIQSCIFQIHICLWST